MSSHTHSKKPEPFLSARASNPFFKPCIQPKLKIGSPDDKYEQEADRMADAVMRMPNPQVQRQPMEEEKEIQMKEQEYGIRLKCNECEQEEKVQKKSNINDTSARGEYASPQVSTRLRSKAGNVSRLPTSLQSEMGRKIGADFSRVGIHTDSISHQLNRQLGARAFTHGSDIYFNEGQYNPTSTSGKHLLAHELVHVVQQEIDPYPSSYAGSMEGLGNIVQRQDEPEADHRLALIIEKLRRNEELTEEELAYVKEHVGREIVQQLLGGGGQILINYDSSREPQDINRRYHGRLGLRLSGLPGAAAGSLEGIAEADIDLVASVANEEATITISPPAESNRMAAMIRERLFPNGNPRSFNFEFSEQYFRYANSIWLISGITVALVGPDTDPSSGAMIVIHHESIPNGVELIMTLSPSTRGTSVEETERDLPNDHWILTPNPRIFATGGYQGFGGSHSFAGTLGADFPLAYDTDNPLIYGGLGVRGSLDTNRFGRLGGNAFVGLNFDPLSLQLGFGLGAAFLPEAISTPGGPAQTVLYEEVEGMAAYRIVNNWELLLLLTAGGGKELPAYGTAQLGGAFHF